MCHRRRQAYSLYSIVVIEIVCVLCNWNTFLCKILKVTEKNTSALCIRFNAVLGIMFQSVFTAFLLFTICDPSALNQSKVAFLTFWVWCTIWKRKKSSLKWHKNYLSISILTEIINKKLLACVELVCDKNASKVLFIDS